MKAKGRFFTLGIKGFERRAGYLPVRRFSFESRELFRRLFARTFFDKLGLPRRVERSAVQTSFLNIAPFPVDER